MTIPDGFAVTIDAGFDQHATAAIDDVALLVDELADVAGAVSARADGRGFSATVSIDIDPGQDEVDALEAARSRLSRSTRKLHLPLWSIDAVEILTYDEQDRRLATPVLPELVGTAEIAEVLGVSKSRVGQLRSNDLFPAPVAELASGPVYTRPSIQRFVDEWKRQPGRPATAPTE